MSQPYEGALEQGDRICSLSRPKDRVVEPCESRLNPDGSRHDESLKAVIISSPSKRRAGRQLPSCKPFALSQESELDNRRTRKSDEKAMNSAATADAIGSVSVATADANGSVSASIHNDLNAFPMCKVQRIDDPWPSVCSRSKPGRRALWKRRQRAEIDTNTNVDAVTDSDTLTGLDAFSDVSAMQLASICRASFFDKISSRTVCSSTPTLSSTASLSPSMLPLSSVSSSPATSSPLRSVFPSIDGLTSPGGCPPPADEAGIAETGLRQAQLERERLDSFGRDANQREWTRHYQPVDEYDSDGDLMPDGVFSESSEEDLEDRERFIAEHSTIADVDEDEDLLDVDDSERRHMLEAGFEQCPDREGFMISARVDKGPLLGSTFSAETLSSLACLSISACPISATFVSSRSLARSNLTWPSTVLVNSSSILLLHCSVWFFLFGDLN